MEKKKTNLPFWATTLTLVGIIVLCGLGLWQVQRLQWKEALLAQITAEQGKDPMSFELSRDNLMALGPDHQIIRGFVEGIYRHDGEIALGPRTHDGQPGYHLITPFETLDNQILLVNRGWVPLDYKDRPIPRTAEPVILTGTARRITPPGPFVPENNPGKDEWYRLAPEEIAAAKGLEAVLPYIFYAEKDSPGLPLAATAQWSPPNNHLSYAIFWFTMASILMVIYYLRFIRKKEQ